MAIIDELVAVLGIDYRDTGDAQKFQTDLDQMSNKVENFSRRATTAAANFGDKLAIGMRRATMVAGTVAAGLGVALGKGVIDASSQWEGFTAALTTIEGSSEKAEKSLDWIADFAKKTPYQLAETVQAFTKLKAYGIDPTQGALRTLGDSASAMNKPLDAAVEMFADAASFQFERLREFGITAKQEGESVTFQFQKDGKTVQETVKKTGEAVTSWVKNNLEGRFGGAMLRQSTTFGGMMSNLGDYWEDFQRRIGRGGFFDTVKNRLADFLDYLDTLDDDGTLDRWSANLSWGFTKVADGAAYLAKQVKADMETLAKLWSDGGWSEKIKPFALALGLLFAALFPVTTLLGGAALALNDWLAYMSGADSVIGKFIDTLAEFLGAEPAQVAAVLGDIAEGAAWFAAAAIGISLFAAGLRQLSGALLLLKGAKWAVGLLGSLAGIQWGAAAAGAAGASAAATAAAGVGKSKATPKGKQAAIPGIGGNRVAATGVNIVGLATMLADTTPEKAAARGKAMNEWADKYVPNPSKIFEEWFPAPKSDGATKSSGKRSSDDAGGHAALAGIAGRNETASLSKKFGVDQGALADMAAKVGNVIASISSMEGIAKASLDIAGFMTPANQALAIQADLSRGINATANLDIGPFMANAAKVKATMQEMSAMSQSLKGIGGRGMMTRPQVAQSAAAP